jgi:hypothetical protein
MLAGAAFICGEDRYRYNPNVPRPHKKIASSMCPVFLWHAFRLTTQCCHDLSHRRRDGEPQILPQSPSDKAEVDMAEDIENGSTKGDATAGNVQVEVTEEEVRTYPAVQLERASNKRYCARIREFVARLIKLSWHSSGRIAYRY